MPSIVGGLDIHRKQLTFDYLDVVTGEVKCGQAAPADRMCPSRRRDLRRRIGPAPLKALCEVVAGPLAPRRRCSSLPRRLYALTNQPRPVDAQGFGFPLLARRLARQAAHLDEVHTNIR